jgi:hypothetical protein
MTELDEILDTLLNGLLLVLMEDCLIAGMDD